MVTDGTSNTVFIAEIRQGSINDIRGVIWTSVPGAASFMTRFTPNGRFDFYLEDPLGLDVVRPTRPRGLANRIRG